MGLENRLPRLPYGYYIRLSHVYDDWDEIWLRVRLYKKRKYWFDKRLRNYEYRDESKAERMVNELARMVRDSR